MRGKSSISDSAISDRMNAVTKSCRILFIAIISGILLLLLVSLTLNQAHGPLQPSILRYYQEIAIGLAVFSIICRLVAKRFFTKRIQTISNNPRTDLEKLDDYRLTILIYLLISEIPILAAIVVYLLCGNFVFVAYAAILLGFLLVMYPTNKRIGEQLGISSLT